MPNPSVERLQKVVSFPQLVAYLRDELEWPIDQDRFEDVVFDWNAEELGLDVRTAAKITEIKQLRPLTATQPWGIFFVRFEPKRLPIVVLRRILGQLVIKKRASARKAEQQTWRAHDLLFVPSHGEGGERQLTFAHFSEPPNDRDLPTLRVLGWDGDDTELHVDYTVRTLKEKLIWPADPRGVESWRESWSSAFVLRPMEVIQTSKDLAIRLADLAKGIRDRTRVILGLESERGTLRHLHKAFQNALINDLTAEDFADMYAQTITYGLFSAAVSGEDNEHKRVLVAGDIGAQVPVTNPFLKELLGNFLQAGGRRGKINFDELGVQDVVDLLNSPDTHLDAVLRDFGNRTRDQDPVIHFYESFLSEYDKKKKVSRGVFYTPQPVVSYVVRSVDELLRTEFDLLDGLADTVTWGEMAKRHPDLTIPEGASKTDCFVTILDPATGTGTFLVEAIDVMHHTMSEKWRKEGKNDHGIRELWNDYVPKYLLPRLHGYELLMAPYAIAHLKIGLKLHETGYDFNSPERARIYLTNALEPPGETRKQIEFKEWLPALAHEAQAVNGVKRNRRFTVVIGNPPYAGHSANQSEWIRALLGDYYFLNGEPLGEQNPKWLQDDYVKFVRLSEYELALSGLGVLGLITNHGYLENPTFRGLRHHWMEGFTQIRILDLHGNSKKKEKGPDGSVDENVFDIQQGVAISLCSSLLKRQPAVIRHSDLYGLRADKYSTLTESSGSTTPWTVMSPQQPFYIFSPSAGDSNDEYFGFFKITEAMPVHSLGVVSARDDLCISWTRQGIWGVVRKFAAMKVEEARLAFDLGPDARDWQVKLAQQDVKESGPSERNLAPILYRPFDTRWTYYTGNSRGFLCMPRREVMTHMLRSANLGLSTTRSVEIGKFHHVFCARTIAGHHCASLKEVNYLFPLYLNPDEGISQHTLSFRTDREPNFSPKFLKDFAASLQLAQDETYGLPVAIQPEQIFHYIYAILHSPRYRDRYAPALRIDFPRVPLPRSMDLFRALSSLGEELVATHLLESETLHRSIGTFHGPDNPEISRVAWAEGTVWLDSPPTKKGVSAALGTVGFRGVPEAVWNFDIGGYQVCEKWLKDRKGQHLNKDDLFYYRKILTAVSETMRMMTEIDGVIEENGGWPDAFLRAVRSIGPVSLKNGTEPSPPLISESAEQ